MDIGKVVVSSDSLIDMAVRLEECNKQLLLHTSHVLRFLKEIKEMGWQDNLNERFSRSIFLLQEEIGPIGASLLDMAELKRKEREIIALMEDLSIPSTSHYQ